MISDQTNQTMRLNMDGCVVSNAEEQQYISFFDNEEGDIETQPFNLESIPEDEDYNTN